MARQRALDPQITPSAYCSPNLIMTGCIPLEENLEISNTECKHNVNSNSRKYIKETSRYLQHKNTMYIHIYLVNVTTCTLYACFTIKKN